MKETDNRSPENVKEHRFHDKNGAESRMDRIPYEKESPETDKDRILFETRKLTDWIRQTESYRSYIKSLSLVKRQKALFDRLNEYRGKSLRLDGMNEDYPRASRALYESYRDVLSLPQVMDFLTAESRVIKKLRIMYDCIACDLDLDLSHMDLQEGGYHD